MKYPASIFVGQETMLLRRFSEHCIKENLETRTITKWRYEFNKWVVNQKNDGKVGL